jgi:hypothetical protein
MTSFFLGKGHGVNVPIIQGRMGSTPSKPACIKRSVFSIGSDGVANKPRFKSVYHRRRVSTIFLDIVHPLSVWPKML